MTLSSNTLDDPTWGAHATGLPPLLPVPREPGAEAFRGFGPRPEIADVTSGLSCSEMRLLDVFKRLNVLAGQSVIASLLWASWRMFGNEAELWETVERLKHRRFIVAGDGRWGLCLTNAGFAILSSL